MRRHDEKREKRKRLFMSLFIVAIMVFSVAGYMIGRGSSESTEYNGFKFTRKNNYWVTDINDIEISFDYFPTEVENINISSRIIDRIKNSREVDITSDFNNSFKEGISLAHLKLSMILSNINIYVRKGFTANNTYDMPVITCEDATDFIPVILFEKYNKTGVYEDGNCIIVRAKSEIDFIAVKDRILYSVFGIIE
ncbi:MAG: hypothetical protein KAU20_06730 [Nanoarchaeota archaeon]|nr:hypothetical protein [Nanoarchaeota archaeon]